MAAWAIAPAGGVITTTMPSMSMVMASGPRAGARRTPSHIRPGARPRSSACASPGRSPQDPAKANLRHHRAQYIRPRPDATSRVLSITPTTRPCLAEGAGDPSLLGLPVVRALTDVRGWVSTGAAVRQSSFSTWPNAH
jgi:hypothetical protein